MRLNEFLYDRVRNLSMFDIKLAQGAAMCVMVIIVKLFPVILEINIVWFYLAAAVLAFKPLYVFYGQA